MATSPSLSAGGTPRVVLDTNVALALWLWRDPRLGDLQQALDDAALIWLSDEACWCELVHELRPDRCAAQGTDPQTVQQRISAAPRLQLEPGAPPPSSQHLVCTDPDDQKFIDLALRGSAIWLLSRDRAVLKLRKRAATLGLNILRPEDWRAQQ